MFYVIGAAAALALLLLFMVCPALRKHPDRQLLEGNYIAHRGLHDLQPDIPENSLPAFALAAKLGYPVELDIHLSRADAAEDRADATENRADAAENRADAAERELRKLREELRRLRIQLADGN